MISRAVKVADIRKDWAENDRKRDEGLTTPENIIRHDDISYGPYGKWNLLDIYHKKGIKVCQPTIVSIHGGAWVYGTKEIYQYYCMSLAQRGFTVVNFNYRLAPENKYPAALEDINQVFVFLKEHGKEYCVDVKNLFVVGDSAGAQLASQYLTIFTNPKFAEMFDFTIPDVTIRAAALNCGIYDARKCAQYQLDEPFMEYTGKEILTKNYVGKGTMESLDTMKYMTSDFPPAFIMSAYYDFLLENAEPMYQHLKSLGVPCEIRIYGSKEQEEIAHVFHVNCRLKEAAECNDEECNFFKKYIFLSKETYSNTGIKKGVIDEICELAKKYDVDRVILFGSRARGDYKEKSDIDLACSGGNSVKFTLAVEEETTTLLQFDIVNLDFSVQSELKESINREGIVIYEKV